MTPYFLKRGKSEFTPQFTSTAPTPYFFVHCLFMTDPVTTKNKSLTSGRFQLLAGQTSLEFLSS
jgi:hypothetical protein